MLHALRDLNPDELVYAKSPRVNQSGGQTITVQSPDPFNKRVVFVTPKCVVPFGISEFKVSGCKFPRRSLQLSLAPDQDRNLDGFRDFLTRFDLKNMEMAVNHSKTWFRKQVDPAVVQQLYNPSLKQSDDAYPPMFRARLPTDPQTGTFYGEIYDHRRNLVLENKITPGCHVEAIVELTGLYFVAREFGASWKVIQLKVYPTPRPLTGYAFLPDEDTESETSDAEPN
eukprot:466198-Prorocentrum_minimum.AAC.8